MNLGTKQNAGREQESTGLGAGPPVAGLSAAGRNARAGLRTALPGTSRVHRKLPLQTGTVRQKELSEDPCNFGRYRYRTAAYRR
ncbi:hypothetical protein NPIL_260201 [Nephila pilipes]|uniref:Uncharacterized protein n=1 Tax=Nephila pilipes TaxID=299642 RepID=A0A8X6MET3_NEPPI|nr:hypothetical protein NPIL_260201 [Nephila pilipes]